MQFSVIAVFQKIFLVLFLPKYFPSVEVRGCDIIFFQIPVLKSLLLTFQKGSVYHPHKTTNTVIAHSSTGMLNKCCGRKSFKILFEAFPQALLNGSLFHQFKQYIWMW